MSTPYDATTKTLLELDPLAWVHLFGLPGDEAELIDADVATVTALADRVIRVYGPQPYLVHVEFQASYDPEMGRRLLRYNVLLNYRHNQPVHSVVVLLRPKASGPRLTGTTQLLQANGTPYLEFHYGTFRVWEQSAESLLSGPHVLAPLVVLTQLTETELPQVGRQLYTYLQSTPDPQLGELLAASYLLAGLRFPADLIERALRRIPEMKESVTYQLLVAEGRGEGRAEGLVEGIGRGQEQGQLVGKVEEARHLLRLLGDKRFGVPSEEQAARIANETRTEQLEIWAGRLLEASSWTEILA